jgi:hypothetical protein
VKFPFLSELLSFYMTSDDIDEKHDEALPDPSAEESDSEPTLVTDSQTLLADTMLDEPETAIGEEDEGLSFTHDGQSEFEEENLDAPAYDLDEGTPLDSSNRRATLPTRTNVKSAKEFFNGEIHYRFDILEDESRTELGGSYRIELKGFQGGIWTVTVGDQQVDVVNRREEAEIVLTMQQRDFLQLVNGDLNPQLAVFAQKMRVSGDLRKAVAFQAILSPGAD